MCSAGLLDRFRFRVTDSYRTFRSGASRTRRQANQDRIFKIGISSVQSEYQSRFCVYIGTNLSPVASRVFSCDTTTLTTVANVHLAYNRSSHIYKGTHHLMLITMPCLYNRIAHLNRRPNLTQVASFFVSIQKPQIGPDGQPCLMI